MELPFDCGCDNRREIMTADSWTQDACVILGGVALLILVFILTRK